MIPADGVIQLAFDRYLLPTTIRRQSFAILDNVNALLDIPDLVTTYDPIARTVSIRGPGPVGTVWLKPEQQYKFVLLVAQDAASDNGGFRALDRAVVASSQQLEWVFHAGPASAKTSYEPAVDFCADIQPILFRKCDGPNCHGPSESAAASLVLTTKAGLDTTAVNRIAQSSNTGAFSSSTESAPSPFGINLKLIAPGDPGSSWLLYKVEMAAHLANVGTPAPILCTPPASAPPIRTTPLEPFVALAAPIQEEADAAERAVLSDLVTGREMPYPAPPEAYTDPLSAYAVAPLTFQEREQLRIWIANGATTNDCGGCGYLQ